MEGRLYGVGQLNNVQKDADAIRCLRCGDLRSPAVTERRNGSLGLRDDDDDDNDDEGCKTCVKNGG